MEFHAEFFPKSFSSKINHQQKLLLIGSCFTEQIGAKLSWHKFDTLENPNGILFNPVSIWKSLERYATGIAYTKDDLFKFNGVWGSWDHHTRFSSISTEECLKKINASLIRGREFLIQAKWILITLGSAFVYERRDILSGPEYPQAVANCHKISADKFNRRLLPSEEVEKILSKMIAVIHKMNPSANIIFTISPVRHLREGFIENNRSKAALIQAVHQVVNEDQVFYFPSYELVIDDLRDYRFFAEDMAHPNYAATNYVWEKFSIAVIDEPSRDLMKTIAGIMQARNHKPFNPESDQHKKFLQDNLIKIKLLRETHPYLNFEEEEHFFESGLE